MKSGTKGKIPPFVKKMYDILNEAGNHNYIEWSDDGSYFTVKSSKDFEADILPIYYKHNNYCSFIRQLNTYGFAKTDTKKWQWKNDSFHRDHPENLTNIYRRTSVKRERSQLQDDQEEEDVTTVVVMPSSDDDHLQAYNNNNSNNNINYNNLLNYSNGVDSANTSPNNPNNVQSRIASPEDAKPITNVDETNNPSNDNNNNNNNSYNNNNNNNNINQPDSYAMQFDALKSSNQTLFDEIEKLKKNQAHSDKVTQQLQTQLHHSKKKQRALQDRESKLLDLFATLIESPIDHDQKEDILKQIEDIRETDIPPSIPSSPYNNPLSPYNPPSQSFNFITICIIIIILTLIQTIISRILAIQTLLNTKTL